MGVEAGRTGKNIINTKDLELDSFLDESGSIDSSAQILFGLLSVIFLENNDYLNIECYYYKSVKQADLEDLYAVFIGSNSISGGHATGFLKCNNILYYYDDNNNKMLEFNWENYLCFFYSKIENQENYIPAIYMKATDTPFFVNKKTREQFKLEETDKLVQIIPPYDENDINNIGNFIFIKKIKY